MKKLVLTGLEQFWPEDEKNAVFLAPWCFAGNSRKSFFEQESYSFIAGPWKNAEDISNAIKLTEDLIDRISKPLAEYLNQYQPKPRSNAFWQMYTTAWLIDWFDVFYDRFCWLNKANEKASIEGGFSIDISDGIKNFPHYLANFNFAELSLGHDFNSIIFSDLLRTGQFAHLKHKVVALKTAAETPSKSASTLRGALFHSAKVKISNFISSSKIQFGNVYGLSAKDILYFTIKLDPLFPFRRKANVSLVQNRSQEHRKMLASDPKKVLSIEAQTPFEKVVERTFLHYLPDYFFHNYGEEDPCNLWVGSDFYTSPAHAWRMAVVRERNGSCIATQHGGGYGISFPFPLAKVEYEKCDRFLTWGWDKHGHHDHMKFHPLPSPKLSRYPDWKKTTEQLVFPAASYAAYLGRLESGRLTSDMLQYYKERFQFLQVLTTEIRKNVLYKSAFNSYGVDEISYLKTLLTSEQFNREGSLPELFVNAKLAVIDQIGTSALEAFAMNVPTILIYTTSWDRFCDTATDYLNELEKVGILYRSPEKAAAHIETIWGDTGQWWQSKEIQEVRERFCARFARKSPDWRAEWLQFLRQN